MAVIFFDGFDRMVNIGSSPNELSLVSEHWILVNEGVINPFYHQNGRNILPDLESYGYSLLMRGSEFNPTILRCPFTLYGNEEATRLYIGFAFKFSSLNNGTGLEILKQHNYSSSPAIQFDGEILVNFHFNEGTIVVDLKDEPFNGDLNKWFGMEIILKDSQIEGIVFVKVYIENILVASGNLTKAVNLSEQVIEWVCYEDSSILIDDFYCLNNTGGGSINRLGPNARILTLTVDEPEVEVWNSTEISLQTVLFQTPPVDNKYIYTDNMLEEQSFSVSFNDGSLTEVMNLMNVNYSRAIQIRSIQNQDSGSPSNIKQLVNNDVVETIEIDNTPKNKTTIFDQLTKNHSEIDLTTIGVST